MGDFDEVGCAPIAEVVKFAQSEYSCVLFKSISNPWEHDSDGDYYTDDIDMFKYVWNESSIKEIY